MDGIGGSTKIFKFKAAQTNHASTVMWPVVDLPLKLRGQTAVALVKTVFSQIYFIRVTAIVRKMKLKEAIPDYLLDPILQRKRLGECKWKII